MRVALFGGSFNPPHVAHQMAALYVLETAPVDALWFVPAFRARVRQAARAVRGPPARCASWLRRRARDRAGAVSDVERDHRRPQPDAATPSAACASCHPEHAFSLVIGSDLVAEVPSLVRRRRAAAARSRSSSSAAASRPRARGDGTGCRCRRCQLDRRARSGWRPESRRAGLVPRAVLDYIYARALPGRDEQGAAMSYMSEAEVNARSSPRGRPSRRRRCSSWGPASSARRWRRGLVRAGIPVIGLHGRQVELSDAARAISGVVASTGDIPDIVRESDVIIISVRDERVPEVAERLARERRLRPDQILLHTSGANPARDDPGGGGAARARGRHAAPAGVVRRRARRRRGAGRGRLRHRGRRAGARDGQAHRARARRAGRDPRRREPGRSTTRAR